MRYIFLGFLFPIGLTCWQTRVFAMESQAPSPLHHTLASESTDENFYTQASHIIQQHLDLIARIEQALVNPDANRLRAVRGQLTSQMKATEGFLQRQHPVAKVLCNSPDIASAPEQFTKSQLTIYCSLYGSSQELWKLAPVLDRGLSRRGELTLVRKLPLVSGEHQSDPILSIAPVQRPRLNEPATPFAIWEANLAGKFSDDSDHSTLPIIGRVGKTAIANYNPPIQPAIAPPETALTILANAKQLLSNALVSFPSDYQFRDAQTTAASLDRFTYSLDPQEGQTYARFLQLPRTGIFRVLAASAYERPLNTVWNRLQPSVSERYPFPALKDAQGSFKPSLALKLVGDRFQMQHLGVDYSFMVDLGDIPLEKLDQQLQAVASPTREFFLNYQPPKQLENLQVDRRRFLTGKDQNWNLNRIILTDATAQLNHTYLVRSLQFQLPEIILHGQLVPAEKRRYLDELQQVRSSDMLIAFRPVRRRNDGSYTVLWRVVRELPAPQILDL
ncbi:hypothetical protein CLI64_02325 [Nostoc sp. CENA543]|uniref:hypothetical protein n=1 Tax=Nostoc sp. CENA543 TaxID=1869241 RepID=UPI000CA30766|nr:hypothetical protein CLI64_02325 [Nostoc sp. CENA543]